MGIPQKEFHQRRDVGDSVGEESILRWKAYIWLGLYFINSNHRGMRFDISFEHYLLDRDQLGM